MAKQENFDKILHFFAKKYMWSIQRCVQRSLPQWSSAHGYAMVPEQAEDATQVAPRDLPVVGGGGTSGWVATLVWGRYGPLPTLATMTLPGVIGWRSPTPGTLSVRWGWDFLKRGPPTPDPKLLLLCQRRGSPGSLAWSSLRAALKRSSKFYATTFSSPLPHAFITLFHPTSQSRASTSPRSTM